MQSQLPGVADHVAEITWCSHKHSPVQEWQTHALGAGRFLNCEGDLEQKCEVPPEHLADSGNAALHTLSSEDDPDSP